MDISYLKQSIEDNFPRGTSLASTLPGGPYRPLVSERISIVCPAVANPAQDGGSSWFQAWKRGRKGRTGEAYTGGFMNEL